MRRISSYNLVVLYSIYFLCLFIVMLPQKASLQSSCPTAPVLYSDNTALGTWAKYTYVEVNIDPTFTDTQKGYIVSGLTSWNNHKLANCSEVTFATPTYNSTPLSQAYGQNRLQISNTPTTQGGAAEMTYGGNGINRNWGLMRVDPNQLNYPEVWTFRMAHELGHTFGMGDCTSTSCACLTVMSYQCSGMRSCQMLWK